MKKSLLSFFAMAMLMAFTAVGYAQTTYTRITSASELEEGAQYIIVGYDDALGYCAMSYQKAANRHAIPVTENGGSISVIPASDPTSQTEVFQITLGGSEGEWTFYDELLDGYLYAASSTANQLKTQTTLTDNGKWDIVFDAEGTALVTAQGDNTRNIMRFNENSSNGTPLFGCYNSNSNINVPVSFYKAGGQPTIYPEPTNYPTNFTATVSGVDVTLTWTDATGAQLPTKYLVLGGTNNITVPTDGTPVANGNLAMNVSYGVQTVTFTGLEGSTTYKFAIFPYTNGGSNIDFKTDGDYPTVIASTANITFLLNEDFATDLGVFTPINVSGDQEWHQATHTASGTTYANMNGYDGGAHANEDWLISPAIADGGFTDIFLEFRTAKKFEGDPLLVKLSLNYDGGANPSSATWEDLTDVFDFSTGNYEWVESGRFNIGSMVQGKANFYVAFVYTSNDTNAASWEVDYVKVVGEGTVSVKEQVASAVSVYPNPANEAISFVLESNARVSIYDVTGRVVSDMNMSAGEGRCEVSSLENGVYFLNIRYNDGKTEVARFVKF